MKTRSTCRWKTIVAAVVTIIATSATPVRAADPDTADFPLGPLGGRAFQTPGTSPLKVTAVTSGGPAATAGLQVGDFIYAINGNSLPIISTSIDDGWRGAVSELGYAIERAEAGNGAVSLGVLRPGAGAVTVNATVPANTAWRTSLPTGDPRAASHYEKACADLHTKIQGSATANFGYSTGWFGMTLLASPNWNDTSGTKPYRNSINKLRDRCVAFLNGRVLEPVESHQPGYVDSGLENWDVTASCMFLGEYRRKTGDVSVDADVQHATLLLANRIQYSNLFDPQGGRASKPGIMGHGGVSGDYTGRGLNIINAHTMVSMAILKGAGADFSAMAGASGLTINQKFLMNWNWLKQCTRTDGSSDDGCVGYIGVESGWDAAGRTPGSAAGWQIYQNAGGTASTADDLDKLARMKAYTARHWQRQQNTHAYSVGGVALSQTLMPFMADRSQRHFMENSRFLYTLSRDHTGAIVYFPGRGNSGGDQDGGYLGLDNSKYFLAGLHQAFASGNLPSFPAPSTTRAFVRMNSPLNDWPQLAARRAKVIGLVQPLNLDVTNHLGDTLASGYTAAWTQVSGSAVAFSATTSEDTTVTFPAAGNYRLRLTATVGAYVVTEDYDFEVATSATPPVANVITAQPLSRAGMPGGNVNFTVGVSGTGPFVYEWKLNGVAYWGTSTRPTLTLTNLSVGHAGDYTCYVHTPTGTLTSATATLTLSTDNELINGGLKREVWNSLSGGTVATLTGSSRYPLFPDVTAAATSIETPSGYGDNYGERYSGWILPPTTGQYKFFVTSDDASEVWLSTTDSPANKVKICQVTSYTGYRTYSSGGQSAFINLTAGQRYYIEILHKEAGGGDHLSLAWQLPGGTVPANNSEPIGSAYLQYEAVTFETDPNAPVSWWKMDDGVGTVAIDSLVNANDGNLSSPVWASGKRGGALTFDGNDSLICSNLGALDGQTPFTAAAWVKVNAAAAQQMVVIQQRSASGYDGQYQLMVSSTGKVTFYVFGGSQQFSFSGTTSINDGQWHHIAGVRDASGNAYIYVDGAQNGSVTGTTVRDLDSSISIGIGADIRDNNKFFLGSIDDVRVYNRALTSAEVAAVRNQAPVFAANPVTNTDATEDVAYSASISATDPDVGETLTYTKISGPTWLAVATNGILSGTPSNSGVYAVTVRATDSFNATAQTTFNITVANGTNYAPAFAADPINLNATEDSAFGGQLAATDANAGDTLTFTKISGPGWLNVSGSGALSGTPSNSEVGSNSFAVRVTDSAGLTDEATLNIAVANVNDAPVFAANPINLSATEDSAFTGQLAATDADASDTRTFSKISGPAWLTVASNGALSGAPANSNVGANNFIVRVVDAGGLTDEAALNITVTNVNDAPVFTIDPILAADATIGSAYTGQTIVGSATDADAGESPTYTKVSGPVWLNVATNGALTGTPPSGSAGLNIFVIRATDSSSATDEAELRINVTGLPLPWTNGDIGTGMLAGSASHSSGTFTLAGSGALGGSTDKLQFTYQTLTGDGEIIARISALQDTGASSRVGVMMRDTLATNSKQAFFGLSNNGSYRWERRFSTGGNNVTVNSGSGNVPYTWVRLVRSGSMITAYKSSDGISWTLATSGTVSMAANCYIGLAVSSGSNTTLNSSQFSNVSVTP